MQVDIRVSLIEYTERKPAARFEAPGNKELYTARLPDNPASFL